MPITTAPESLKNPLAVPSFGAKPGFRACGWRAEGGLYLEVGIGWNGKPVADFLVDPPKLVYPKNGFPLPVQGMGVIMDPHGVWHLVDRVGLCHYPYPADFVDEAKVFGVSRRMQKGMKLLMLHGKPVPKGTKGAKSVSVFALLSKESRLLLVHDRAFIRNCEDYLTGCSESPKSDPGTGCSWTCPKWILSHQPCEFSPGKKPAVPTCAGLWWCDYPQAGEKIENGSILCDLESNLTLSERRIIRSIGSITFKARRRPKDTVPDYAGPAVFMSLPIGRFVVVKSGDPESDTATLTQILSGPFPASLVRS